MQVKSLMLNYFLLYLLSNFGNGSCETFYITSSQQEPCPAEACLSLFDFASNSSAYVGSTTTALLFLPGNHSLITELVVANINRFLMIANSTRVRITCKLCGQMLFSKIDYIHLNDLEFFGCGGNTVESVVRFEIENSVFLGQDINCGSALSLINSTAQLFNSSFIANFHGSNQNHTSVIYRLSSPYNLGSVTNTIPVGGAIYATNSVIFSVHSTFKNNSAIVGSAIYCEADSNITIINNTFVGNSAKIMIGYFISTRSIIYCKSCHSMLVVNSSFHNNTGYRTGRMFMIIQSMLIIIQCQFRWNEASNSGGIVLSDQSRVFLSDSLFSSNTAGSGAIVVSLQITTLFVENCNFFLNRALEGGVFYIVNSGITTILSSTFEQNIAESSGGAIYINESNMIISKSSFINNRVLQRGGALYNLGTNVINILESYFSHNIAFQDGGAIATVKPAIVNIHASRFFDNVAYKYHGGAVFFQESTLNITDAEFARNSADYGGAIYIFLVRDSRAPHTPEIRNSTLSNNTASNGALSVRDSSTVIIVDVTCTKNDGGVLYIINSIINAYGSLNIHNNRANLGVVYIESSVVLLNSEVAYANNAGSFFSINSNVNFTGSNTFVNCSSKKSTGLYQEGGAITAHQSNLFFHFRVVLRYNDADHGGAMYALKSKLYVYHEMHVTNNTASNSGGGFYLFKSELIIPHTSDLATTSLYVIFLGNVAHDLGGGVHAISSSINLIDTYDDLTFLSVYFQENEARKGGGLYLEGISQLQTQITAFYKHPSITFVENIAEYGGAVFVDDSNTDTCSSTFQNKQTVSLTIAECFFKTGLLANYKGDVIVGMNFSQNSARISGQNLYGGLLERCAINRYTYNGQVTGQTQGLEYFTNFTPLSTISSDPVRVCFCSDGLPDCTYRPPLHYAKKGEKITVSLVAVDQINSTKTFSAIQSYLNSSESNLAVGQQIQITQEGCTDFSFSVHSPHQLEEVTLYASGPCRDARPSQNKLQILFLPCVCPVGFQANETLTTCECECDHKLLPYIHNCDPQTETLNREGDFWVSAVSTVTMNATLVHYLIFPHCPLDYCTRSKILLNLNIPNGSDKQCINNRSGKLCGTCQPGLSLSIGSSNCIPCPKHWPVVFAVVIIVSILAGIVLVTLLLVCNLTVAVGTLNGLIFYANIIDANKSTFLQFLKPNFVTVSIAWLNLDIGFDVCFFKGVDSYWKTWLQLIFPLYIIILVMLVIYISERSVKFAQLIGRRNPVATLATLILLSYTKILRTVIAALSFAVSDDSNEIVWLTDGNVRYFSGKHIPLFITALLILVIGGIYTAVLFSWQWLLQHQDKMIFKFVKNERIKLFLEPYHAPYTYKHRYWTGLLQLVRVILYLCTVSVSTVVHEPARWNLLIIFVAIMCLLLPKIIMGVKIYKKIFLDLLEIISYFNIILFCMTKLFAQTGGNEQDVIAYISGTIFFVLLLSVFSYHTLTELCFGKSGILRKLVNVKKQRKVAEEVGDGPTQQEQSTPTTSISATVVEGPSHKSIPLSEITSTTTGIERLEDNKNDSIENAPGVCVDNCSIQVPSSELSMVPYQKFTL